jgi:hypothetical protein
MEKAKVSYMVPSRLLASRRKPSNTAGLYPLAIVRNLESGCAGYRPRMLRAWAGVTAMSVAAAAMS